MRGYGIACGSVKQEQSGARSMVVGFTQAASVVLRFPGDWDMIQRTAMGLNQSHQTVEGSKRCTSQLHELSLP